MWFFFWFFSNFSAEEAGNYLETYKMYENKSADMIKEKQDDDNYSQVKYLKSF